MPTDDERREVARRLRKCTPPTSYRQAQGGGWAHLCDMAIAVGLEREDNPTAWELAQRLADLIDPDTTTDTTKSPELTTKFDRDALLALADELENDGMDHYVVSTQYVLDDYARRIREALEVTDG